MKNFSVLFLSVMMGLLIPASAQSVISYPNGFASSSGQIYLGGNVALSGSSIHLVTSATHTAGNAWFETPENEQAFTTTFTFHIVCTEDPTDCAGGMGFQMICSCAGGNPTYNLNTGGNDAGFTYSGYSGAQFSFSQCVAPFTPSNPYCINGDLTQLPDNIIVTFNNYDNATSTPGVSLTAYAQNGAFPVGPVTTEYNMAPSGIDLNSGDEFSATLTYNGSTLTESLTDTVTSANYTRTYTGINIPGAITGDTALIGFSGGTGAGKDDVYVDTWTYTVESPGQAAAAAPTFSPGSGTYSASQNVTLSTTSSGAIICYNTTGSPATNGSTGCASGTLYAGPVTVSSSETLYAVAGGTGYSDSSVASSTYVIQPTVSTPTFSPAAGAYASAQSVTISDATSGATIYYTTNGTTPTTSSTPYTGPITVNSTETLQAIAAETGDTNSAVASAAYTITSTPPTVSTPTFSPAAGAYTSAQSVTISDATSGATIYYTTNGTTPTTSSTQYTGPITVSSTETLEAIAVETGDNNSAVASAAYTITSAPPPTVSTPTFSPAAGAYTSAQSVTISDATSGATIYYTTNGTTPTTSSTPYTGPITVSSTETLQAIAVDTGDTNSAVASAAYTINSAPPTVSTPTFSPAEGAYASAQSVTISDTTSGATIYYTTNGTTPTTSSTQYTGPITVSSTETLQAIAVDTGDTNSAVASAAYTMTLQPDFVLSTSLESLTVNPGGQGTLTLTLTPENGFNSPVALACYGLPSGASCSFEEGTVTLSGGPATTQLTITTGAQSSALQPKSRPFIPLTALAMTVCLFGRRRRRDVHRWLLLAVAYGGLGFLAGCAGIQLSSTPTTSTVTVTAISGTLQQKATIMLTVN